MHISEDDLFPLLRQRMLLKTFRSNPWLTIDQIYTVYKGMLLENIYLPCHDPMRRDSLATLLLEWSKMPDGLIREKRGRHVFYRVNEEYDSETGRLISWLKSSAKKIMGWERNHNYAS